MSYQPPTAQHTEATREVDANARTIVYKCGDCDGDVPLKRGEPIRCRNCGHRVLYKQRTNRMVQFEAR
ncbi:DNA-directed RNA polymerase core subunit rpc10 [Coniothyrium glycines]